MTAARKEDATRVHGYTGLLWPWVLTGWLARAADAMAEAWAAVVQGLTLVHFSAQLERIVWDRECA